MPDPEVKLKFSGDQASAERAIATLERKIQQLENNARHSTKSMRTGVTDFISALTGISGPIQAASKAMQVFKADWDDLLSRQRAAGDATEVFARELQQAANNADVPLSEVKARLMDIVKTAQITPAAAAKLLNIGQAAKGTLDESAIDKTIIAASKVSALDEGTMEGLVNTSLDIRKQIEGTTAEQSLGFILGAMAKTRVPDTEKFTKNVLPSIIGVTKLDNTPLEFSAALSAGITQAASDTEGRKSRTAMTALALQLRDAFPELENTETRVRALQESPELRDAFLRGGTVNGKKLSKMKFDVTGPDGEVLQLDTDRASFERQMVPAMEQVLTKGTFASNMLEEALKATPSLADSEAAFKRRAADQAADPNLRLALNAQRGRVDADLKKVNDLQGAEDAIARTRTDEQLKSAGFGSGQRYMIFAGANARYMFGGDEANYSQSLSDAVEAQREGLETYAQSAAEEGWDPTAVNRQLEVLTEIRDSLRQDRLRPVDRNGQVENKE